MSTRLPSALARTILTSALSVYLSDRMLFATRDRTARRRILRQDCASARQTALRAVQESYLSLAHAPFAGYARQIQVRTLLLTGTRDPLCTPGSLARFVRDMTRATVHVVPSTGHLMPVERPAAAAAVIERFLSDTR